jgi:hypothetical protein
LNVLLLLFSGAGEVLPSDQALRQLLAQAEAQPHLDGEQRWGGENCTLQLFFSHPQPVTNDKHCVKISLKTQLNSVSNELLPFIVGQSHDSFSLLSV